jgi:hypothetical protein
VTRRAGTLAAWGLALAAALAGPVAAQAPIRFTHRVEIGERRVPIPMELYLEAVGRDVIAVKVAGNLGAVQAGLPILLSSVVEDTCRRRIGVEIQEIHAEGDSLRATGRVQIISYRCNKAEDYDSRRRIFSNITEFDALVGGAIESNCLTAELQSLTLDPKGLIGGFLNLVGLTDRIAARASEAINGELTKEIKCIDLPAKLRIIDTNLARGGFRDFGDGTMGFVVSGTVNVRARNVVALIADIARDGDLSD